MMTRRLCICFALLSAVCSVALARASAHSQTPIPLTGPSLTADLSVPVDTGDVATLYMLSPYDVDSSAVVTPSATVHNFGRTTVTFPVRFTIENESGPVVYMEETTVDSLPGGGSATVTFPTWPKPHPLGYYATKCSTMLDGDNHPGNDAVSASFTVGPGTIDVGVMAIVSPAGTFDTSVAIAPLADVKSFGSFPISFKAFFSFNSTPACNESISISDLSAGTESLVTFPTWAKPHAVRPYVTNCSVYVAGDGNHINDALAGSFAITEREFWPGWTEASSLLPGARHKNVKNGAALAYQPESSSSYGYVYAFKGNNTREFYRYSVASNTWASRDSIPAIGRSGRTKGVRKGSSLTFAGDGRVYATKGNNSCEFWQYDPTHTVWTEMANEVPTGSSTCKEGVGMTSVTVAGKNYVYLLKGSGTYEFYRYNVDAGTWETMASAPAGSSHRPFKNGSSITCDGGDTIYCLKGSDNEFFAYSIAHDNWTTLETLPKVAPPGTRKTKVKDGSGIAFLDRMVYALKGDKTNEFWKYWCDSHRWAHSLDLPNLERKVNEGGALVAAPDEGLLFAFRGNNTPEFWAYSIWGADGLHITADAQPKDVQGTADCEMRNAKLRVSPNPLTSSLNPSISYSLPCAGNISLKLYDITGKLVTTLARGYTAAGSHHANLDARHLANGVYILKLESGESQTATKLVIK